MRSSFAILCLSLWTGSCCLADSRATLEEAARLEVQGQFQKAATALGAELTNTVLTAAERKTVAFELDRLERIKKDYTLTREALYREVQGAVKDLTQAEFERWVAEGRFDSREIDGQRWFMGSSVSNLFFRYSELSSRRLPPKDTAGLQKAHWESCVAIRQAARAEKKPYVLPKRFEATMTVTAKSNTVPAGEVIRAWLPVPRRYPFQGDFELSSTSSPIKRLADEQSPIRYVYLEEPAVEGQPTTFQVQYHYTSHGVSFDLKPAEVQPVDPKDPQVREFLREGPHVVFTPEMRRLAGEIAGAETNPCGKAKKFYDWIAEHIQYSYAIEYSTIRNISDYCRSKGYGDCGQEALLFITLCRLSGIPARWQSGWATFPGDKTIHDWSEIYVPPYGWVPVDPYMGIYAMRYATALSPEQRRELRDFYFGGLDQFRMIANSDHNQALPKKSLRSDTVDFQRGELEWGEHNLYFNDYSYDLTVKEIELRRTE